MEKFYFILKDEILPNEDYYHSVKCAILSTKNTISVLMSIKNTRLDNGKTISIENELELDEQRQILTELESRI